MILHLDHIRGTQIKAALAHSGTGILADNLRCVPQEIRTSQLAFDENGTRLWGEADHVGILIRSAGNSYSTTEHCLPSHRTPIATKVECCMDHQTL
jgi:hypothetical protein